MSSEKRKTIAFYLIFALTLTITTLYTIEKDRTVTTIDWLNDMLVESNFENVNSEASTEMLAEVQELLHSNDYQGSKNYLELEGRNSNYRIQFRYEDNREIRIVEIEEIALD
ncbi:ribosomal protein S8 [Alkalihalobacillus xiaoxiensis]|uniref:Ribosomal protein S8 n=1 Tax=Shouchella xiaoxiensis TaxID=766895 RepID=A0ABS2SWD3_9BACI|nr:hypothetical protein [Shouchella xiaoxiensis]MBM7839843.1 ribosomal protein S8 [Shouchella xiaoxiensis]